MFVKRASVKKRKLSKLEGLRLRRELSEMGAATGGAGGGGSRASPLVRPTTTTTTPRKNKTIVSPPKRSAAPVAGGGGSSKLEELRARREKLAKDRAGSRAAAGTTDASTASTSAALKAEDRGGGDSKEEESNATVTSAATSAAAMTAEDGGEGKPTEDPADSTSAAPGINLATATPGYRAELRRLQVRITSLESTLIKKDAELSSVKSSLDFMSKGAEQSTHDAVRMYAMGALALTEAKTPDNGKGGWKEEGKRAEGEGKDDDDSDGSDSSDEEDDQGGVVHQAAAAVSQALVARNDELSAQLAALSAANADLEHQLSEAGERAASLAARHTTLTERYDIQREARAADVQKLTAVEAVQAAAVASLERELRIAQERAAGREGDRGASHASAAKMRAELDGLRREKTAATAEREDLETTLEELVLDKEQLREEKEMLEDQVEEYKIDLESAQLELEDAKSQHEEGRESAVDMSAEGGAAATDASFSSDVGADAADVARSLTLQNTRLRTALLRLKEQSELERGDLQRRLRALETDAADREGLAAELTGIRAAHAAALAEARELHDVIDQNSALEETIETLSDKVWHLEEANAELERTVRELDESAEVQAEMEEVQGEELKMVLRDLEGRDALVGNLEEAIRMQRRREEDFQRYVSEFRTAISTLKSEKAALLAATTDNQGEKSHLLATSQKALAQAAQLAADAAENRKRSSEAVFQKIAARSAGYLSQRLETLLPSGVVSAELAAVKGEMSLAQVADKAAASLVSVEEVFNEAIDKGSSGLSEFDTVEEGAAMAVSDAASQQIAVMTHQAEFSRMVIEGATDALRLMAAGQWPELLSQETSTDLGSVVVHSVAGLDLALSEQLRLLKSEGMLSPLRSSLADLDQSVNNTRLALFSATDESGKTVIPNDWKPPGFEALKSLSLGRFACLGATAVLSSAVSPMVDAENEPPPATPRNFGVVLAKAKQSCSSMVDVCKKFSGLPLNDTETLDSLNDLSSQYQTSSRALFDCTKTAFEGQSITGQDVDTFSLLLEKVLTSARLLAALLRKADLGDHETANHHYLSAEFGDSWGGICSIVSGVRSVDGDAEDVNYLMRARAIENQLAEAVQNEPKLVIASTKIAGLEKRLSSRSKEIQMQNSRIAELESLISKSSVSLMSPIKEHMTPGPSSTPVDTQKLKEEVRVLQEAMDHMQKQAEEYEKEIRSLKDKSRFPRGVRTAGGRVTPKKNSMDLEATLNQLGQASGSKSVGSSRDVLLESISLETALFRPALSSAVQSASYWKSKAMGSALSKLAPLNVPVVAQSMPLLTDSENGSGLDDLLSDSGNNSSHHNMKELALARNEARLAKASFSIVDLCNNDISPRAQLHEERQKEQRAKLRLQKATSAWLMSTETNSLASVLPASLDTSDGSPLGRITLPCRYGVGFVAPLTVNNAELKHLHSSLVQ